MKIWLKRGSALTLLTLLGGVLFSLYAGNQLIAPSPHIVGDPPSSLSVKTIKIQNSSGRVIMGWISNIPEPQGSVLLLHGIRADRRSMIARAKFLIQHSYNVLLVDFQAHGESPGNYITMGHLESKDVVSSIDYLRTRFPDQAIGVIGSSLGGAATVLADCKPPPDAIVLEAVFSDVTTAVNNRLTMRFGAPGKFLSPLLTCQIQPLLGISIREMSPIARIHELRTPAFLIYGSEDRRATPSEGRLLYSLAPEPKEFWLVDGAAHVDLHRYAGKKYEQRILSFFKKHLPENRSLR